MTQAQVESDSKNTTPVKHVIRVKSAKLVKMSKPSTRAKAISWTESEEDLLLTIAAQKMVSGECTSMQQAASAAQLLLFPENSRGNAALTAWLNTTTSKHPVKPVDLIRNKMKELEESTGVREIGQPAKAVKAKHTAVEVKSAKELEEVKSVETGLQPTIYSLQQLMYKNIWDMAGSLVDSMVPIFKNAVGQLMDEKLTPAFTEVFQEKTSLLRKKLDTLEVIRKKVLVVGVIPDQEQTLSKEFKDVLDLSFVQRGGNINLIPPLAASAQVVIYNLDAVNHKYTDQTKGHKGVITLRGGLTALTNALIKVYAPN